MHLIVIALQDAPRTRWQLLGDLALLLLVGMTGPFIVLLFGVLLFRLVRGRWKQRYNWLLIGVAAHGPDAIDFTEPPRYVLSEKNARPLEFAYWLAGFRMIAIKTPSLCSPFHIACPPYCNHADWAWLAISIAKIRLSFKQELWNSAVFLTVSILPGVVVHRVIVSVEMTMDDLKTTYVSERHFYLPRLLVIWTLLYRRHTEWGSLGRANIYRAGIDLSAAEFRTCPQVPPSPTWTPPWC